MMTTADEHRAIADRLLTEATARADREEFTTSQTLLELSEAHLEAANRADVTKMVTEIADTLRIPD